MAIDRIRSRQCLNAFDFRKFFIEELGWDKFSIKLLKQIDSTEYSFQAVAEKRGVVVLVCNSIPEYAIRVKLDRLIAKDHFEHLIVFADQSQGRQVWQWVRKEPGKPTAVRTYRYEPSGHAGELLLQKLDNLAFTLEEEEEVHTGTVTGRLKTFDVEKVTKKFYERFKTEHDHFLKFIKGIPDTQMESWYASVMINRLMFLYFIQEKGFLSGEKNYLRNKLAQSSNRKPDAYYSEFLSPLFFQGFARKRAERSAATNKLLGEIPYLNGGLFQKHQIEELHGRSIVISDKAFAKLFDFFKEYNWHLDERENRDDREINPDVLGYIFEKYINQKQMGAYYTKEDITEYIGQNTIIPFLLDEARKGCAIAFAPDGSVWNLLREHPDRYIHDAMKKGAELPLPPDIEAGIADVAKRTGWNRTTPEEFALPTEIWREAIDRHQRYRTVKAKLAAGEVHQVNDLVTLNLNIRQFAQDVIQFSEGPELLRAIWKAIEKVSVLDPTCGSGAFLFAALNILKPLYEACLQRMRGFVEDMEAAGTHRATKFEDFKKLLAESERHPKQDYFTLKAIIVNNLFGVDIMEEAVEICKLRLFLKLVAQVDSQDRIEPLPDIDFNIRAANTLVGYARLSDIRPARGIRTDEENEMLAKIEDNALILDAKVRTFRIQQTQLDGTVTAEDKTELRSKFAELESVLNGYLSGEYGVKKSEIAKWKESHKPFHWFCDFHAIMQNGGFDVIIGNPPYLEKSKFKQPIPKQRLETIACPDIYAWIFERALSLRKTSGRLGLIVPVSIAAAEKFTPLREVVHSQQVNLWMAHFANRPGQLFTGAQNRLSIVLMGGGKSSPKTHTTRYHRWDARGGEREGLLDRLHFADISSLRQRFQQTVPKLSDALALQFMAKIAESQPLGRSLSKTSNLEVLWVRVPGYFCQFHLKPPMVRPVRGGIARPRGELLKIRVPDRQTQQIAHAALNSTTFYVYFCATTDARHINPSDVTLFPFDPSSVAASISCRLAKSSEAIVDSFARHTSQVRKSGLLIDSVKVEDTKHTLDQADRLLAEHYGFSPAELDFVLNYDIKYRLRADADEDADEA